MSDHSLELGFWRRGTDGLVTRIHTAVSVVSSHQNLVLLPSVLSPNGPNGASLGPRMVSRGHRAEAEKPSCCSPLPPGSSGWRSHVLQGRSYQVPDSLRAWVLRVTAEADTRSLETEGASNKGVFGLNL